MIKIILKDKSLEEKVMNNISNFLNMLKVEADIKNFRNGITRSPSLTILCRDNEEIEE